MFYRFHSLATDASLWRETLPGSYLSSKEAINILNNMSDKTHLHLKDFQDPNTVNDVMQHALKYCGALESLVIEDCALISKETLRTIASHGMALKKLDFNNTWFDTDFLESEGHCLRNITHLKGLYVDCLDPLAKHCQVTHNKATLIYTMAVKLS